MLNDVVIFGTDFCDCFETMGWKILRKVSTRRCWLVGIQRRRFEVDGVVQISIVKGTFAIFFDRGVSNQSTDSRQSLFDF